MNGILGIGRASPALNKVCVQCLGNTYCGDFSLKGADLRARGLNRVGNMLVRIPAPEPPGCAVQCLCHACGPPRMPIREGLCSTGHALATEDVYSACHPPGTSGMEVLARAGRSCAACHCCLVHEYCRTAGAQVPNSNYCAFEDWVMPVLSAMLREQREQGACWTPSKACLAQTRKLGCMVAELLENATSSVHARSDLRSIRHNAWKCLGGNMHMA